jgi:chromosome segregation ATPase
MTHLQAATRGANTVDAHSIRQVYNLSQVQQKIFDEENPELEGSQSWLAKSTSVMTSASELSSSESSPMPTSASEGDGPAKEKAIKEQKSGSDTDAAKRWRVAGDTVRKENKKLQAKVKKGEATASNLKRKMKQDSQALQIYIKQVRDANGEVNSLKQEMKQITATITAQFLDEIKSKDDEIQSLKRHPQRKPESEPAPILEPEQEENPSPEPEVWL